MTPAASVCTTTDSQPHSNLWPPAYLSHICVPCGSLRLIGSAIWNERRSPLSISIARSDGLFRTIIPTILEGRYASRKAYLSALVQPQSRVGSVLLSVHLHYLIAPPTLLFGTRCRLGGALGTRCRVTEYLSSIRSSGAPVSRDRRRLNGKQTWRPRFSETRGDSSVSVCCFRLISTRYELAVLVRS